MLTLTAACLVIGEQFPFSDFPMYSSFRRTTYYVYLADEAARPLPTIDTVGIMTPMLMKMYDIELRREIARLKSSRLLMSTEQKRPVGERILQRLKTMQEQNGGASVGALRLYEVNISVVESQLNKRTDLIAEVR